MKNIYILFICLICLNSLASNNTSNFTSNENECIQDTTKLTFTNVGRLSHKTAQSTNSSIDESDIINESSLSLRIQADENYIITALPIEKQEVGDILTPENSQIKVDYIRGFGEVQHSILVENTPTKQDFAFVLNRFNGLNEYEYLPIPIKNNNGEHLSSISYNNLTTILSEVYHDDYAFSITTIEDNLRQRVSREIGPGEDWHKNGKAIKHYYVTNGGNSVKMFQIKGNKLSCEKYYPKGSLFNHAILDENDNSSSEFTDFFNKKILTRQINNTENHDTYYVYDESENLKIVLPPLAADLIKIGNIIDEDNDILMRYAYMYKYDEQNRCIAKRLPGCDWIHYVYDKTDQLILLQDGEQRKKYEWTFNAYDKLGRIVFSGTHNDNHNLTRRTHKQFIDKFKDVAVQLDKGSWFEGYTTQMFELMAPSTRCNGIKGEIKIINFYDDYTSFSSKISSSIRQSENQPTGFTGKAHTSVKGLMTATVEFNNELNENINNPYLCESEYKYTASVMHYDEKGRLIQTKSTNHLEGIDKEFIDYNFSGQPVKKKIIHTGNYLPSPYIDNDITKYFDGDLVEEYSYTYDHAGRLRETIRNGKIMETLTYNELGQLSNRKQGDVLVSTYEYNIRGWMKKHVEDNTKFEQALFYTEASSDRYKNYNGNISYMTYKQGNDLLVKSDYMYDGLSRMTQSAADIIASGYDYRVSEEAMTYDKHGNIKYLMRGTNNIRTDDITLYYRGNQLIGLNNEYPDINGVNVVEYPKESGLFTYNANGALTSDSGHGIVTIKYNSLNLPELIQFSNGNQILNNYSAGGTKLQTKHITAKQGVVQPITNGQVRELNNSEILSEDQTDYVGNIIIRSKNNGYSATEYKILFEGGYDKYTRSQGIERVYLKDTYYQLKDYLGNIRSTTNLNNKNLEVTEYHSFGTPFRRFNGEMSSDPYKFGGKEFDRMHGLDWYDFHARQYDPVLSRFHTVDPLAEKYYSISPYAYCANNPMKFIDPDGRQVILGGPAAINGLAKTIVALANNSDLQDVFVLSTAIIGPLTGKEPATFKISTNSIGLIDGITFTPATSGDLEAAQGGLLVPVVSGNSIKNAEKNASKLFDGANSTNNKTSREALRNAKDQNGIPRSQQPNKTTTVPDKNTGKPLKQYEYTNSKGEKVTIRKDNPVTYPDGGKQGPHYNAGKPKTETDKLKQHHNYEK